MLQAAMRLVADVGANVVLSTLGFTVDLCLVFRPSNTVKLAGLVKFASRGVDITTLAQRNSLVVGGTSASNGNFGTRELVANALVDT